MGCTTSTANRLIDKNNSSSPQSWLANSSNNNLSFRSANQHNLNRVNNVLLGRNSSGKTCLFLNLINRIKLLNSANLPSNSADRINQGPILYSSLPTTSQEQIELDYLASSLLTISMSFIDTRGGLELTNNTLLYYLQANQKKLFKSFTNLIYCLDSHNQSDMALDCMQIMILVKFIAQHNKSTENELAKINLILVYTKVDLKENTFLNNLRNSFPLHQLNSSNLKSAELLVWSGVAHLVCNYNQISTLDAILQALLPGSIDTNHNFLSADLSTRAANL
jgi:GTPase SAR1 family protein